MSDLIVSSSEASGNESSAGYWGNSTMSGNVTARGNDSHGGARPLTQPQNYPVEYRILATVLHVTIFVVGVCGNVAVVLVVRRTKALYTPTFCYLVSETLTLTVGVWTGLPDAVCRCLLQY